jgi:hypothetical protein
MHNELFITSHIFGIFYAATLIEKSMHRSIGLRTGVNGSPNLSVYTDAIVILAASQGMVSPNDPSWNN